MHVQQKYLQQCTALPVPQESYVQFFKADTKQSKIRFFGNKDSRVEAEHDDVEAVDGLGVRGLP